MKETSPARLPMGDSPPAAKVPIRAGTLRRLLPFLRPYLWPIAGASVALVIAAGTVLALGLGLRRLVDRVFAAGDPAMLDEALILLLVVTGLLALSTYARFLLVSWVGERMVADMRCQVFNHLLCLSSNFFETTRTGEVVTRLTADTTLLQQVVGSSVSVALRNILLLVGGVALLMWTSPRLTGLVLVVVPLVVVPIILLGRQVRRLSSASQDRLADIGALAEETIGAIRTVHAYGREDVERARFASIVDQSLNTAIVRVRTRALMTAIVIALVFGAIGIILWIGGHDVLSGHLSAGDLSAFVFYAVLVAGAVGALSEVAGDLQRASGATQRLFDLLSTEPIITAPAAPVRLPQPTKGLVAFEEVVFAYPSRPEVAALDTVSLMVEPGKTLAIVGPSGAGKTTLFQLLLRFFDPASGVVRLDGVDIRDLDPTALRQRFALVAQDPVIFSASAADNVRYGRPDAGDAEVMAALAVANAAGFVDRLPNGPATFLGERGVRLSGGQRQRLAIARAVLRDPAVLLLDEATSSLDSESERRVQTALDRLRQGRTTLVIAHRLSTVMNADTILVMDRGRVVQLGTHAGLMREGGMYKRLAQIQFATDAASA